MTTVYQLAGHAANTPGTHVLVIGVGSYLHLVGGDDDLVDDPMGLAQLQSPPVSAAAVVRWFMGRQLAPPDSAGYRNPNVPLASIEVAVSPGSIDLPGTPAKAVDLADMAGIEKCFDSWRKRCVANPNNIAVFYFCGHGVMTANQYLLAADFGGGNPWTRAFDVTNTVRALEREIAGPMYFFIDSCRQIPRALAMQLGANPLPIRSVDLGKPVINGSRLVLYAAGEGKQAFAQVGQVSRYTASLLQALSGYSGRKRPGSQEWEVTGEDLARSVRCLLEAGNRAGAPSQVVEQDLNSPTVLHVDSSPARVIVGLDLKPDAARPGHKVFLQKQGGASNEADAASCPWRTEVPRGFYNVGARDQNSPVPIILHEDEELEPPHYELTLSISS